MGFAAVLAVLLASLAAESGLGQTGGKIPPPAGYLRYTYQSLTGSLSSTTTTEITPMADGRSQVVTTIQTISNPDEVRLGAFGLQWLELYLGGDATGRFDISLLNALSEEVLVPQKTYVLPDGVKVQARDRVTVAGYSGVECVFTRPSVVGVTIIVVLADDLQLRQLLPFPLRMSITYVTSGSEEGGDKIYEGQIELIEYTTVQR
jgi:hypothetical protein